MWTTNTRHRKTEQMQSSVTPTLFEGEKEKRKKDTFVRSDLKKPYLF